MLAGGIVAGRRGACTAPSPDASGIHIRFIQGKGGRGWTAAVGLMRRCEVRTVSDLLPKPALPRRQTQQQLLAVGQMHEKAPNGLVAAPQKAHRATDSSARRRPPPTHPVKARVNGSLIVASI